MKLKYCVIANIQSYLNAEVQVVGKNVKGLHYERADNVQILCSIIEDKYNQIKGGIEKNMVITVTDLPLVK